MIGIQLVGSDKVRAVFSGAAAQARSFATPLFQCAVAAQSTAVRRIKMGGDPAWAKAKYPQDHRLGVDTGVMWRSIGVRALSPNAYRISTNVKYARYFQEGTGIFAGHSGWRQVPVNGNAIAFSIGGVKYVRRGVNHRGQPARPFLYWDAKDRDQCIAIFERWLGFQGQRAA